MKSPQTGRDREDTDGETVGHPLIGNEELVGVKVVGVENVDDVGGFHSGRGTGT